MTSTLSQEIAAGGAQPHEIDLEELAIVSDYRTEAEFYQASYAYYRLPLADLPAKLASLRGLAASMAAFHGLRLREELSGEPVLIRGLVQLLDERRDLLQSSYFRSKGYSRHEVVDAWVVSATDRAWASSWSHPGHSILKALLEGLFHGQDSPFPKAVQARVLSEPRQDAVQRELLIYSGADQPAAVRARAIGLLSRMGADGPEFRARLLEGLQGDARVAFAAARAASRLPQLEPAFADAFLGLLASELPTGFFFSLIEETIPAVLKTSPGLQLRFFDGVSPEVLGTNGSVAFHFYASFGSAGTVEPGVIRRLVQIEADPAATQYGRRGAAYALGALTAFRPQKASYHLALIDSLFSPHPWMREAARSALRSHYAENPEFLRLLDEDKIANQPRMREIAGGRK